MKVHIELIDQQGNVVAEYTGDASQPGGWRATAGQRLIAEMPKNSDNENNGAYELFGFTYQPFSKIDRPNGWTAPVPNQSPSPNNGPVSNLPVSFPPSLTKVSTPKRGMSSPAQSEPRGYPPAITQLSRG